MQNTSELWKTIWASGNAELEYRFDINGISYGPENEVEHAVDSGLFEDFGIGNATTAKLTMGLFAADIPRGATIKRFVRIKDGEQVSEWIPKGVYFANRRLEDDGYWTIEAFDAMRKSEKVWSPDQSLSFPMPMSQAVNIFCNLLGVELDARTEINPAYTIDYPANDYTIRDELCFIAAAHAGNWIMTDAGRLYLIPLLSIPKETSYLVDEHGNAITFGGDRILV